MVKNSGCGKLRPDFRLERECQHLSVAGIDEAGCGPWAGPVVAAAVVFFEHDEAAWQDLNDSKKLVRTKRDQCYAQLTSSAQLVYGVGSASVAEIDTLNIARATCLAMERAVLALPMQPEYALIDGIRKPKINLPLSLVVKGDSLSLSIAAASIIAKVTRDRIMTEIGAKYPEYGWENNAGYGTALHRHALNCYGVTLHHRRSFAPIRQLLNEAA